MTSLTGRLGRADRAGLAIAPLAALAAAAGGLAVAAGGRLGLVVLVLVGGGAASVLALEAPSLVLAGLVLPLAVYSEEAVDNVLPGADVVYGRISLPEIVLGLLLVAGATLALRGVTGYGWPGAPATLALGLFVLALGRAVPGGVTADEIRALRPLGLLAAAVLVGYWLGRGASGDRFYRTLVAVAPPVAGLGLYNAVVRGELAFYDAATVFLLGVAALLVLFRAVELGSLRVPYLLLLLAAIVPSFRRGAILALLVALLVAAAWTRSGGIGLALGGAGVVAVALELASPGLVLGPLEDLFTYFTGASGQDANVNYRGYERHNAWLNVRESWLVGIGPTADWTLFHTFGGRFPHHAVNTAYLHDSFLWTWVRYGLLGLLLFAGFLAAALVRFLRARAADRGAIVTGASVAGLVVALVTASYLTTTLRWPTLVGLLVGVACARTARQPATSPDAASATWARNRPAAKRWARAET